MNFIDKLFGYKCEICKKNRTKNLYEEKYTCDDCELDLKAKKEKQVKCPECSVYMDKEITDQMIVDRCPNCKGVFLSRTELEKVKEIYKNQGDNNGMMMGMVIGSAMSHR